MIRRATLILLFLGVILSAWSQSISTVHTFNGSISDIKNYGNGVVFTGTSGAFDKVVMSPDGSAFSTVEASLVSGSTGLLVANKGSYMAFYHGDDNGGLGTELRRFNGSSAGLLVQFGQGDIIDGASILSQVTAPVTYHNGMKNVTEYFYLIGTPGTASTNMHLVKTDGTDFNTVDVPNGDLSIGMIMPYDFSRMDYAYFNNKLFYASKYGTYRQSYSSIYTYDYQISDATNDVFFMGKETNNWSNLIATANYLYTIDANSGEMLAFDADGTKYPIVGMQFSAGIKPVNFQNRVFATAMWDMWNPSNDKLVYLDGTDTPIQVNINAAAESDNIQHLVLSGNKVFFVATPTGGRPSLYAMRTDITDAAPLLIDDADFATYDITHVEAVDGGVVYTLYNNALSPQTKVKVTEGFAYNTNVFAVKDGDQAINEVTNAVVNNNSLFLVENKVNTNDVLSLTHTSADFTTGSLTVHVVEGGTTNPIAGAMVTISNGLYEYSSTTDGAGNVTFDDISDTGYSYTVSASGYSQESGSDKYPGTAFDVELSVSTSISNPTEANFTILPNPFINQIELTSESTIVSAQIYNLSGSLVYELFDDEIKQLDLGHLAKGLYILVANNELGQVFTYKIARK